VAELADAPDSKSGPSESEKNPQLIATQPVTGDSCAGQSDRLGGLLGAFAAEIAPADPDLAALLAGWPTLPDPIRAGIVAMVKASGNGGGQ
jgi:NAD(P)H-hydrate repair Nnr-like enzyme with NAD(P)H-hydrate dehydratase domain